MADGESPFSTVPDPVSVPRISPVTYEQQLASVGALAVGLQNRPRWLRLTVRSVAVLFGAVLLVAIVWGIVTA